MKKLLLTLLITIIGFSLKAQFQQTENILYHLNGNVGIGIQSPRFPLQFAKNGGGGATAPTTIQTGTYLKIGAGEYNHDSYRLIGFGYGYHSASPAYIGYQEKSIGGATLGDLVFGTRDVLTDTDPMERMRITSDGSIKVGTRVSFKPSRFGYSSSYKALILGSTGTSYSTDAVTLSFGYDPSTNTNSQFTGNGSEILFRNQATFLQPNSANNNYLKTLSLNDGNVGIGTSEPHGKLHINSTRPVIIKHNGGNGVYGSEIGFNSVLNTSDVPNKFIKLGGTGQYGAASIITDYRGNMYFQMYNAETEDESIVDYKPQIQFANTGDVTIDGKVKSKEVEVKANVWPDYVFEANYDLPTLEEVENYIKTHKHLPDVPSEKEVKENGLNLGQSDAVLLQKIEELTLYLIEQNKEIKILKEAKVEVEKENKTQKKIINELVKRIEKLESNN